MTKPSWYFTQSANGAYPLFENQHLDDEIVTYLCACGEQKIIHKNKQEDLVKYSCEVCGDNTRFRNAEDYYSNSIWYNCIENLFDKEFLLSLEPKIDFDEKNKALNCNICIKVPEYFDTKSNEVIFLHKSIFRISTDESAKLEYQLIANFNISEKVTERYSDIGEISAKELSNRNPTLKKYKATIIRELTLKSVSNTLKQAKNLDEFEFFMNNSHLKNSEFFQWENINLLPSNTDFSLEKALEYVSNFRPEKSVKKKINENYIKQLNKHNKYNFIYVYAITRCISDVNILTSLIELDLSEHFSYIDSPCKFIPFLKYLNHKFSEKQSKQLFKQYKNNEHFWLNDSVTIFFEIENRCEHLEIKRCRYDDIHDSMAKYHSMLIEDDMRNTQFTYENKFINACKLVKNYEVKLPANGRELYEWSNELMNCLSSYGSAIDDKRTVVFGFFEENNIKFAVEIDYEINQASAKYNKKLTEDDYNLVLDWFSESFESKSVHKLSTENLRNL
jgi:hypothetical protein